MIDLRLQNVCDAGGATNDDWTPLVTTAPAL